MQYEKTKEYCKSKKKKIIFFNVYVNLKDTKEIIVETQCKRAAFLNFGYSYAQR